MSWLLRFFCFATGLAASQVIAQPISIDIPQYKLWCAKVENVVLAKITDGEAQAKALAPATKTIADAAIAAGASAIGIPAAEDFTPTGGDSGTLTVCAAVDPTLKPPADSAVEERLRPAEKVVAVICGEADIISCQHDLVMALGGAPWKLSKEDLETLEFRIGPVETEGSFDTVAAAALTNHTAIIIAIESAEIQDPTPRTFAQWVVGAVIGK